MPDYLLLYQQSWTNPGLENLSCASMLPGGFTTHVELGKRARLQDDVEAVVTRVN